MTDLSALREAVAKMTARRLEVFTGWLFDRPHDEDCPCSNDSERHAPGCGDCECENHDISDLLVAYKALRNAVPALLDEVERLREQMAGCTNAPDTGMPTPYEQCLADLAAMTAKRNALFEEATKMGRDLAAARAVLDGSSEVLGDIAVTMTNEDEYALVEVVRAAWLAWKERWKP